MLHAVGLVVQRKVCYRIEILCRAVIERAAGGERIVIKAWHVQIEHRRAWLRGPVQLKHILYAAAYTPIVKVNVYAALLEERAGFAVRLAVSERALVEQLLYSYVKRGCNVVKRFNVYCNVPGFIF